MLQSAIVARILIQEVRTLTSVPLMLNPLALWSRPMVDFLPVSIVNVSFMNRLKMELFPTPYSPHSMIL